jgi:hypothetical protein
MVLLGGCARAPEARPPQAAEIQVPPLAVETEILPQTAENSQPAAAETEKPPAEPPAQANAEKPPLPPPGAFHDKCGAILKEFVDDNGAVNYRQLKRKRLRLRQLLEEFDRLDRKWYDSWPEADKKALWINAYNIQLLNIIIENYPIQSSRILRVIWGPNSIRHIKGIWEDYKFIVMDEEFTLAAIEYRYFRRLFPDPRVFLAACNACVSSPPLRNEPYRGETLGEQLDDQARKFVESGRAIAIDRPAAAVRLSAIFQPNWFGSEFVEKYGIDRKFKSEEPATRAVLNFLSRYIPQNDVDYLEVGNYSVEYLRYDWDLNE